MLFIASSTPPDTIFSVIIGVRRRHRVAVAGFRARVDRCSKWCRRDGLDEQRRPAVRVDRRRVDAPGRGCHSPPLKPWFATRYNWRGRRRSAQRCGLRFAVCGGAADRRLRHGSLVPGAPRRCVARVSTRTHACDARALTKPLTQHGHAICERARASTRSAASLC